MSPVRTSWPRFLAGNPHSAHLRGNSDAAHVDDEDIGEAEVRAALESLLGDERLRMSERNRRFLRFAVEEKLAGRAERIKSYTIAVDVFGRPPTFDAIADPIVRIEATRLRAALASFNREAPESTGLRIEIPKGSYVPVFRRNTKKSAAAPQKPKNRAWLPAATLAASAAIAGFAIASSLLDWQLGMSNAAASAPLIAVEPVQSVGTTDPELSRGLTQSILSSLSRFPGMRLVHMREGRASMAGQPEEAPLYILQSSLRASGESLRFWWSLSDVRTFEILWSENVDQPTEGQIAQTIEDRIAARVATRIAEPDGIVGISVGTRGVPAPGYQCVLQARAQQAWPDPVRHARTRKCLEQTVAFSPEYADAWALLSLTYLYDSRRWGPRQKPDMTHAALQAAERATQLDPRSGLAYLALFASYFRIGDLAAADEAAERALELNPHDPEILLAVGLRAYVRGRRDEGLKLIRSSAELTGRARTGTQFVLALDAYREGDFHASHALLESVENNGSPFVLLLSAAGDVSLGETDRARTSLKTLLSERPGYEKELRGDLAAFHFSDELTDLMVSAAQTAGLNVP